MPLGKFYETRLAGLQNVGPMGMGVTCRYTGDYRKPETFADIEKRRAKVDKLLDKYR